MVGSISYKLYKYQAVMCHVSYLRNTGVCNYYIREEHRRVLDIKSTKIQQPCGIETKKPFFRL